MLGTCLAQQRVLGAGTVGERMMQRSATQHRLRRLLVLCIHIQPVLELKGALPGHLLPTALPIQSCLFQDLETPSPPASLPGSCFLEPRALGCCLASLPALSWGGSPDRRPSYLHQIPFLHSENTMGCQEAGFQGPPLCHVHAGHPLSLFF